MRANPSGKAQRDRLVELKEQMLYLVEVPDSIRFLESRLEEIAEKTDMIDAGTVERTGSHERGDSWTGSVAHIEERVQELDSSQKTHLEMINGMSEDFRATLDVVRNEIADVNARLNLTMRAMTNQGPAGGGPFRTMNTVTEEAKVTLATMHLFKDAKLWWRFRTDVGYTRHVRERKVFCFVEGLKPWTDKANEQRVQDLTSVYVVAEQLFDLSNDSQDESSHPSSSSGGNRNNRPSSPKTAGGDKRFNGDRRPHQSNTGKSWRGPSNQNVSNRPLSCFVCKGPHLARKCLNKTAFNSFQASLASDSDDRLDRPSPARWVENDFGHAIKEGSLARRTNVYGHPTQFVGELKEILCVLEKYRDVMPDSLPKSLPPRKMIDHEIELVPRAKLPAKNAYRMAPPKLAELRKQLD
ncbi:reverse transcriptase [Cucumis melo var. makuwa]|uniref:Reverse transcriptase n=1 Tax=Cucumis melo var. makuwa TaxID=1194695 RepID=A0A5A7TN94_CUCMM|nr:reverse transcriptase [Cucumis melo var. makuwa]